MRGKVFIPDSEYKERAIKAGQLMKERGIDVLIANSNEADFSNVRYFSRFWPLFETAGVAVNQAGEAVLMVGPESAVFGQDKGVLETVMPMLAYRESADPAYPEFKSKTYRDVFKHLKIEKENPVVGIGGWLVTTLVHMENLKNDFPKAEARRADDVINELRKIKSANELACIREGLRITKIATEEVLKALRPGVTELQMVGVAQRAIYENGAEYEGLPHYVFSESSTRHAISRPSYKVIGKNDIVQLNLSARVDGYSPSIGMPVSMGKLSGAKRELVEFNLENHRWTLQQLKAGKPAGEVAKAYYRRFVDAGKLKNFVYGPCHGTGLIEVEPPWMETSSNYLLEENMTFQVDTFVAGDTFGARWENGAAITKNGCELLSPPLSVIHEID